MHKAALPLPITAPDHHSSWRTSKRHVALGVAGLVLATFLLTSSSRSAHTRIDIDQLDRLLEIDTPSTAIGGPATDGLTSLGAVADQTYHLGTTEPSAYRSDLDQFIHDALPEHLHGPASATLHTFLPDSSKNAHSFPSIPHKIWQTAKRFDPDTFHEWKEQPGFDYAFMNDADADVWVQETFAGSRILWTWQNLDTGILRSDFLRYLLIFVEGGTYSDTDTRLLKPITDWGSGATNYKDIPSSYGPPSLIVGVEADVGNRVDWHDWWPRPLQICQWTLSGAAYHPVLLDTIRRVYERTVLIVEWKTEHGLLGEEGKKKVKQMLEKDKFITAIMEHTGPGVFTDAVMRYLAAGYSIQWPALKDLSLPLRVRDTVVLPVTGFSPGVGLFNAGEVRDRQAMVHHMFAGSWKHNK